MASSSANGKPKAPGTAMANGRAPANVLALDTNDLSLTPPGPSTAKTEHSPGGLNLRLTVPKRQYSVQREDSLERMATPVFDRSKKMKKKGPSSPGTVLTMAGLFVVGVILMLSGVIVLCQHPETAFIITGCLFLGIGFTMIFVCAILQRKNIVKLVMELNQDLYFLKSDSYMRKLMSEERSDLPSPQQDGFKN